MGRIKKHANHLHVKKRLLERFGIALNKRDHASLCQQILDGNGETVVERQSRTRTLHKVFWEGQELLVVYDKKHKNLVTALSSGGYHYGGFPNEGIT